MIEAPPGLNLWDPGWCPDAIVITTNGVVNRKGEAVMGRGCAREAKLRIAGLDVRFGQLLQRYGNHVAVLAEEYNYRPIHIGTCAVVSFPVKHHWREDADLELIERSVGELLTLVDQRKWGSIIMPRPGCGNGRLSWSTVRSLLVDRLDDRFVVVRL